MLSFEFVRLLELLSRNFKPGHSKLKITYGKPLQRLQNSKLQQFSPMVANKPKQFARLVADACEAHPMDATKVVQVSARIGWIIEITQQDNGYRCWVVNRELDVLSDGQVYSTSSAALAAGRLFVERG